MKKIISLILAIMLIACQTAVFADGCLVAFDKAGGFTVTGTAPENCRTLLTVKAPLAEDEELSWGSIAKEYYYVDAAEYNENGFSFNIPKTQNVVMGTYNFRLVFENGEIATGEKYIPGVEFKDFVIDEENLKASVNVDIGTGNSYSTPTLIVALYNKNGALCSVKTAQDTTTDNITLSAQITDLPEDYENNKDNYYVKAFFWYNLNNLVPVGITPAE